MKLIFLDVDGVLNSRESFHKAYVDGKARTLYHVDPDMVARLNKITDTTGAKLVLSSVWRYSKWPTVRQVFRKAGMTGKFVGKTPRTIGNDRRGTDIQRWLDENKKPIESFIIIDDDSDMEHLMHRLVHTTNEKGLEDKHIEKAITLLTTGETNA